jgi:hypothetical protein
VLPLRRGGAAASTRMWRFSKTDMFNSSAACAACGSAKQTYADADPRLASIWPALACSPLGIFDFRSIGMLRKRTDSTRPNLNKDGRAERDHFKRKARLEGYADRQPRSLGVVRLCTRTGSGEEEKGWSCGCRHRCARARLGANLAKSLFTSLVLILAGTLPTKIVRSCAAGPAGSSSSSCEFAAASSSSPCGAAPPAALSVGSILGSAASEPASCVLASALAFTSAALPAAGAEVAATFVAGFLGAAAPSLVLACVLGRFNVFPGGAL